MLEAMFRKAKESGAMPEFLKDALRRQYLAAPEAQKPRKKPLTREHVTDVTAGRGEAA
jgi:hypothetical protein